MEKQEPQALAWEEMMPPMTRLQEQLLEQELDARLLVRPQYGPMVLVTQDDLTARLSFFRLGDEEPQRLLLNAVLELPVEEGDSHEDAALNCQLANSASLGPIAELSSDGRQYRIRSTLPTPDGSSSPEVLRLFLELLWDTAALVRPQDLFLPPDQPQEEPEPQAAEPQA